MNYDNTDIAHKYDAARQLPAATLRLWLDAIARHVRPAVIDTIVDVGCGTGRFSAALADRFHARVIGIDPSRTMLQQGINHVSHPEVCFREGEAEHLPVDDAAASLVFLSMVYHHLNDLHAAVREFRRVLRRDGLLVIRNSTRDTLDDVPYLHYFPGAKSFNKQRFPSRHEIITTMQAHGFSLLALETVKQEFAGSWRDYCDKVGQRALSDLAGLPDSEFAAGMECMHNALAGSEADDGPVSELIDLFVFNPG